MIETIFVVAIVVIEILVIEYRRDSYCVVTLNTDSFAEGKERTTLNGNRFCAYTGIPYARSKRFEVISFWDDKTISYFDVKQIVFFDFFFINSHKTLDQR